MALLFELLALLLFPSAATAAVMEAGSMPKKGAHVLPVFAAVGTTVPAASWAEMAATAAEAAGDEMDGPALGTTGWWGSAGCEAGWIGW